MTLDQLYVELACSIRIIVPVQIEVICIDTLKFLPVETDIALVSFIRRQKSGLVRWFVGQAELLF